MYLIATAKRQECSSKSHNVNNIRISLPSYVGRNVCAGPNCKQGTRRHHDFAPRCCSVVIRAQHGSLRSNVTSSTKTEVGLHNALHCRQTSIELRRQATRTENFVKFGHVVFELCVRSCGQTDMHKDTLIAILRTPSKLHISSLGNVKKSSFRVACKIST